MPEWSNNPSLPHRPQAEKLQDEFANIKPEGACETSISYVNSIDYVTFLTNRKVSVQG